MNKQQITLHEAHNSALGKTIEKLSREKAALESQLAEANHEVSLAHTELDGTRLRLTQLEAQAEDAVNLLHRSHEREEKWSGRAEQAEAREGRLRAAVEAYPEWTHDEDGQAPDVFVTCLVCGGGGKFNDNGKPSKRMPPTHKPDCLRVLALQAAAAQPAEPNEENNG